MRWLITTFLALTLSTVAAQAADSGKVLKVLPHYLDLKGRASLSPSLYARDNYQALLRQDAALRGGVRFDVRWKASHAMKLRVEARGVVHGKQSALITRDLDVPASGLLADWSKLTIDGDDFKQLESLTAWRATLWDNGTQVSEYKSFLW